MSSAYRPCPQCGLLNIRERHICKRCRANLDMPLALPLGPATEQTGHVYRDATGRTMLFVVPAFLEYTAPGITIRTPWLNIASFAQLHRDTCLLLVGPAAVNVVRERDTFADDMRSRLIPLTPFGYPTNKALQADLMNFAPHLRRRR